MVRDYVRKTKEILDEDLRGKKFEKELRELLGIDSKWIIPSGRKKSKIVSRFRYFQKEYLKRYPGRRKLHFRILEDITKKEMDQGELTPKYWHRVAIYNIPAEGEEITTLKKELQQQMRKYLKLADEIKRAREENKYMALPYEEIVELAKSCDEKHPGKRGRIGNDLFSETLSTCKKIWEAERILRERREAIRHFKEEPTLYEIFNRVLKDQELRKAGNEYLSYDEMRKKEKRRKNEYIDKEKYSLKRLRELMRACEENHLKREELTKAERKSLFGQYARECEKIERALKLREKLDPLEMDEAIVRMAKRIKSERKRDSGEKGREMKMR